MARFSLATGLRSAMQWDQADMSRGVAWIHPDQAKAGKAIGVPLNGEALAVLSERRREHNVYVFTFQGKPVDRCSTRAWKQALARAGILTISAGTICGTRGRHGTCNEERGCRNSWSWAVGQL